MTRIAALSSPLLLGFEEIERALDRLSKATGDGYPPYNIERLPPTASGRRRCASRSRLPASRATNWKSASRRTSW